MEKIKFDPDKFDTYVGIRYPRKSTDLKDRDISIKITSHKDDVDFISNELRRLLSDNNDEFADSSFTLVSMPHLDKGMDILFADYPITSSSDVKRGIVTNVSQNTVSMKLIGSMGSNDDIESLDHLNKDFERWNMRVIYDISKVSNKYNEYNIIHIRGE